MADQIVMRILTGWQILAEPNAIVNCNLQYAHSIDEMQQGKLYALPLALGAEQCEELGKVLIEKAAQSRRREAPAKQ